MKSQRKKYSSEFKTRVVLEALSGRRTLSEIGSEYAVHPNLITKWKTQALEVLKQGFDHRDTTSRLTEKDKLIDDLYRKVGKLEYSLDWLKKKMGLGD